MNPNTIFIVCFAENGFVHWWDSPAREQEMLKLIDYYKYLRCSECKKVGLYCYVHRAEVEKLLESQSDQVSSYPF